jgi:chromosomal replication initiator protein
MKHLWVHAKESLAKQIPPHTFQMWIEPLCTKEDERGAFQLICPNTFFRKRITEHFLALIQSAMNQAYGGEVQIMLSLGASQENTADRNPIGQPQQMVLPNIAIQPHSGRLLHKDYTFDQFVVGCNNDFAYSAALSLAVRRNTQQHALFLLSKSGMGKSHLSQAIGHKILSDYPMERVYYMTAEDFTNEMVSSYRTNSVNDFKEKYHKLCDVLLLEDIHYLSGKDRTQIELAHTLDSLYNENKKIIFSSCYAPTEIPKLNENLRSRLSYGLISNIDPPDFRTRLRILNKYAEANGWHFPNEVLEYLASELVCDVRQLKSGLAGVAAKASLMGCSIDLHLAASVVKNMVTQLRNVTIGSIKKLVCKYYNISHKELVSKSRKQAIVRPRQIGIYLSRRYTDQPLQTIGKSFNRYHATALHAIGAVEKGIRAGAIIQRQVEYLSEKIESGEF